MLSAASRATVLLLCVVNTAQAQSQSLEFGPLRFGMTLEEIRAATPDIAWKDVAPPGRGRAVDEIEAANVTTFAGMLFGAKIYHGPGNMYRITFLRDEPVANAAVCESKGIALVTDLETRVGAFGWPVTLVTGEQVIHVGTGSIAMVSGWTDRFRPVARNSFESGGTTGFGMRARSTLGEGREHVDLNVLGDLEERVCHLQFVLKRGMF